MAGWKTLSIIIVHSCTACQSICNLPQPVELHSNKAVGTNTILIIIMQVSSCHVPHCGGHPLKVAGGIPNDVHNDREDAFLNLVCACSMGQQFGISICPLWASADTLLPLVWEGWNFDFH